MARAGLKRRGAPLGNQNARKHGFYSSVLLPSQEALLPRAKSIRGLNDEIAVARIRIVSVVSTVPTNPRVLSAAINSLLRLERAKQSILTRRRTADSRAAKLRRNSSRTVIAGIPSTSNPLHERECRQCLTEIL